MKIKVLPDIVVNQISAGEVVERPASVVRELVDNAIDAGATDIAVELEHGGQSLIKVVDNGSGMTRADALLAFERHATSKITSVADLDAIATMGFRGEALASIAAISKVVLRTRHAEAAVGSEVIIEGGVLKGSADVAINQGTSIEVRSIFYNTPARRKFLKAPRTEVTKIKQWIIHSALARPQVRYRLIVDGAELLVLSRARDSIERGKILARGTAVPVRMLGEKVSLEGLVAHPSLAQGDSSSFVVLVNSRVVVDRMVQKAVREGFDSTLKDREYPLGFIHIQISPEDVDVNVHPQKSEVRFRDSQAIFKVVREGVLRSVQEFRSPVVGAAPVAAARFPEASSGMPHSSVSTYAGGGVMPASVSTSANLAFAQSPQVLPLFEVAERSFRFTDLQPVGQVLGCYLIAEFRDELFVVDMHAAHERYNFNIIRNSFKTRTVASQQLLVPEVVHLTEEGMQNCLAEEEMLTRFGFSIEPFGDRELLVRAVPAILKMGAARDVIREISAVVCEGVGQGRVEEQLDYIAARLACHASVRSGDLLKREEVLALFSALDSSEFSAACPHGRPVIVSFARAAVERWFGRDS